MARQPGSKEKIRELLKSRVGEIVTAKQIQECVGLNVTEWARRLRELRNDEGWKISSHNNRGDLKSGEYVLEEEPPPRSRSHGHSRPIPKRLRRQVLERDGHFCKMCGTREGDRLENGRPARMHVGRRIRRIHGGTDALDNLWVLCSDCNQGVKYLTPEMLSRNRLMNEVQIQRGRRSIAPEMLSRNRLMNEVQNASEADQREALKWLQRKFNATAGT